MEPEASPPDSQEQTTGLFPVSNEFSPYPLLFK
jgi:hypothetical protein